MTKTATRWSGLIPLEQWPSFKLDGKEYPATSGKGSISWKETDKNTLESTSKLDGKVISTSRMTFSSDGNSRTVVQKGVDSKGNSYDSIQKGKRAGGPSDPANLLIGRWEIDRAGATGTFPPLFIEVNWR